MNEPKIAEYFSLDELKSLTEEMVKVVRAVLGETAELQEISFYNDRDNFFNLNDNTVHFGLAVINDMIAVWEHILTQGGQQLYLSGLLKKDIQTLVRASLRRLAAHEAGHRVIDRHPVTEMGIPQEVWGQVGISSLANALMDCRDDGRIMALHSDLEKDERTGLKFKFGPGGPLDWPASIKKQRLKRGYRLRFTEFDCEAIRWWNMGALHPDIDAKVAGLLEAHKGDVAFLSTDRQCVPKRNPTELEVKAKGQVAYRKVAEMYKGDYQKLIDLDRDNQTIHQAISIIGLFKNDKNLPSKLKTLLEAELAKLDKQLAEELEATLENQRKAKEKYKAKNYPIEHMGAEIAKKASDLLTEDPEGKKESSGQNKSQDYFDLLGPAVHVEELSDDLREWLKKLFEEMQKEMEQEILQQLFAAFLQQLLENPEKFLKQAEDELNKKLRSPMVPATHPTHEEMEEEIRAKSARPRDDEVEVIPPERRNPPNVVIDPETTVAHPFRRQLEKYEKELDELYDMEAKIDAWKEAIYATVHTGQRLTDEPAPDIDGTGLIHHLIRTQRGEEDPHPLMFLESAAEQEKITLSILWRTDGVRASEALKVMLFLKRIYEDDSIRKYFDLEILMAQPVEGFEQPPEGADVPVVLSFGQRMEGADWERLLNNLLAIQKKDESEDATLHVVNGPLALQTQRERILRQNPGSKRRFVIDFWDELTGRTGEMSAIKDEISKTKEALRGKAFCIVFDERGMFKNSPAKAYGEGNYLGVSKGKDLITYLDIVVRSMIQYKDDFAEKTKEMAKRELGIDIREKLI